MPNPALTPSDSPPPADSGNGILAHISGDHIARGSALLARPGPDLLRTECDVVLDVPSIGAVKIAYRLSSSKRGRARTWFWIAVRADLAD